MKWACPSSVPPPLQADGSVVAWGKPSQGGDGSNLEGLDGFVKIYAGLYAFVACRAGCDVHSCVAWGDEQYGGRIDYADFPTTTTTTTQTMTTSGTSQTMTTSGTSTQTATQTMTTSGTSTQSATMTATMTMSATQTMTAPMEMEISQSVRAASCLLMVLATVAGL